MWLWVNTSETVQSLLYQMHDTALYWTGKQIAKDEAIKTTIHLLQMPLCATFLCVLFIGLIFLLLFTLNDTWQNTSIYYNLFHITGFVFHQQFLLFSIYYF